jgi:hypothetical protein
MTTTDAYRLHPGLGIPSTAVIGQRVRVVLLPRATESLLVYVNTVEERNRAERLRDLARWSITDADLDWDHLDTIDEIGWGVER